MIDRLQLFRNVGQFDSVASAATIALGPLTLCYAENGRGKTTLAAILRSPGTNDPLPINERRRLGAPNAPHVVIDYGGGQTAVFQNGAWGRVLPEIAVFDDVFVDENVYSGLVVDPEHRQNLHELILGAQGVTLSQDAVARVEGSNRALRTATDGIPTAIRGALTVEAFCALPARDDSDQAIVQAEQQLAAANQQDSVRRTGAFDPIALPEFDEAGLRALLARTLDDVDAAAMAKVQQHFQQIGDGGENWVESGLRRVYREGDTEHCPYCDQSLAGSEIIQHYRSYFSAEYTALKADIAETDAVLTVAHFGDAQTGFVRRVATIIQRLQFWARFAEVPELAIDTDAISTAWAAARDAALAVVRRKEAAPLGPIPFPPEFRAALTAYNDVRADLARKNGELQAGNGAIAIAKERAAVANVQAITATLNELRGGKVRHTVDNAALCAAYYAAKEAKADAEAARDAARQALDTHRAAVFPAYQTAINVYLQRFGAGFRIDQVTSTNIRGGSSCTYNVLVNNHAVAVGSATAPGGTPSFKTVMSAGDRNTLALAFFFASLDQDQNRTNKIVVIDDPITSLDDHRVLTTVQEMRRLVDQVAQVIVLSHNKPFLCNVWEGMDSNRRVAIEVARDGAGSTIRAWDVSRDCISEHDKRHELMREFVVRNTPNGREVAQAIRPTLEAFLRVSFPANYPPSLMLGQFRGICQQRVGTANELLDQADVSELNEIIEYANRFHHDTNPAYLTAVINDTELLGLVQRTLAFARR